ncbi:hypothetical protein C8A01DRAFT_31758 [Parachaetomium inaequale]|uniref:Uncharacterized protein n=1 Tax=Parachaetomium inaequale TaxID=2588326 RepID=A0AAN6PND2_9PEZI|nr:hypothetical protein C8A01DRAFT_31758 [Parachaetomium inaequale]
MTMATATTTTTKPIASPFPPTSIPPSQSHHTSLPSAFIAPTALRFPATWRCGTCAALHSVLALMTPSSSPTTPSESAQEDGEASEEQRPGYCPCLRPCLQAVYDQFGELYLFWRDDPAVSDLRVPRMADEARWRVWRAGGDGWGVVLGGAGDLFERGGFDGEEGDMEVKRPGTGMSQSSVASDESRDSMEA